MLYKIDIHSSYLDKISMLYINVCYKCSKRVGKFGGNVSVWSKGWVLLGDMVGFKWVAG